MKITKVNLKNYKRFTNLSIEGIPPDTKLVVLVGPNGCGKSSIFDAFELLASQSKGGSAGEQPDYHRKDPTQPISIEITNKDGLRLVIDNIAPFGPTIFYIRSPYRYTADVRINSINTLPEIRRDDDRPRRIIDVDSRLTGNYQRLIVDPISRLYKGDLDEVKGKEIREGYVKEINEALREILGDVQISHIGDPLDNQKNQLYFSKGLIKEFAFKNLGAGEKEVVDLIIDLIIKKRIFNNTTFCIDEPELHINTAIQAKLLKALLRIIPDNSQLWVATHSMGFIEEASRIESSVIVDFSEKDFDIVQVLKPIEKTKDSLRKIYKVALENLVDFVLPQKIIFCEGEDPEKDEKLYTIIFKDDPDLKDTEFIFSKSALQVKAAVLSVLETINRALSPKRVTAIIDRDYRTDDLMKKDSSEFQKVLGMYSIENYLLHPNNVQNLNGIEIDGYREYLITTINQKLPKLKEKVTGYIQGIKNEKARQNLEYEVNTNHKMLKISGITKENFRELYPYIPIKEVTGDIVDWYNENYRKNGDQYSKEKFVTELAQILAINKGGDLYNTLKKLITT